MNPFFVALRYIYPLSCVFIPCMLYQIILYRKWTPREKLAKGNLLWRYVFILYLFMVMNVVGVGSIWDILADGLVINRNQINLIPFQYDGLTTRLLNVLLFMPLGVLLPLIWGKYRTAFPTILVGSLFSLSIELGQLFNYRMTDVDDLIMNVIGTTIGFSLWCLFQRRFQAKPKEANIFSDSPLLYMILALLGSFFLNNWRWTVMLYGGITR